jgi:hypothetical protein
VATKCDAERQNAHPLRDAVRGLRPTRGSTQSALITELIIEPEAEAELEEAGDRYEESVPGLGLDFLLEMRERTLELAEAPLRHPVFGPVFNSRPDRSASSDEPKLRHPQLEDCFAIDHGSRWAKSHLFDHADRRSVARLYARNEMLDAVLAPRPFQ